MENLLKIIALIAIILPACLCVTIKPRNSWGAEPARSTSLISGAVDYVIIHHANIPGCSTESVCQRLIKYIQTYHMSRRNYNDIGYNFLIAGDGNVYEGRGWGLQGSHAPNYNRNSIGIVFLGNFEYSKPSDQMLRSAEDLIDQAISDGYLQDDYTLLGHRQTKATSCPGTQLYNEIKTWSNWRNI